MKLKIVNLHDGLIHPQTKERLPVNRQLVVEDRAFWLRRIEQGHCRLVDDAAPVAPASERDTAEVEPAQPAGKKTRRRTRKAPAPAAPGKDE